MCSRWLLSLKEGYAIAASLTCIPEAACALAHTNEVAVVDRVLHAIVQSTAERMAEFVGIVGIVTVRIVVEDYTVEFEWPLGNSLTAFEGRIREARGFLSAFGTRRGHNIQGRQ
jgi:hypothetical protein